MYKEKYDNYKESIEKQLEDFLKNNEIEPLLNEAMSYSLLQGGKRLRPVLALSANELLGGDLNECLPLAAAIEMIHTYSLIHDDLPAMDNSDYRRGKFTNHKIYGEDMAVLAGDALLNYAFEKLLDNALLYPQNISNHLKAINHIAKAAGAEGMISGQSLDLNKINNPINEDFIENIHKKKTAALIIGSLKAGIQLADPNKAQIDAIESFGYNFGLAFQVIDDILDITQDSKTLGKDTNKDTENDKRTFPDIYGLDKSKDIARDLSEKAIKSLDIFGEKAIFLKELSLTYLDREY